MYKLENGKEYYFVTYENNCKCWYKAKVISSFEYGGDSLGSKRQHHVMITDRGSSPYSREHTADGDRTAVYTTNNS